MARPRSQLNNASSKVIQENILLQDPEGLPGQSELITTSVVPEMKRVIFINERDPGVALHFHYHSKTHYLKHYTLYHGMEHLLPVEIIDHLENCAESIYGYKSGPEGHPEQYVKGLKYIFRCKESKKVA